MFSLSFETRLANDVWYFPMLTACIGVHLIDTALA